jgi:prolyl-tRNA synthetase
MYKEFVETELAIPVISGIKSEREKFAGALATYAIEGLMSDGKALQMGTSHNLGQHFSKVFNIRFEDRNQKLQYAWQTSWGMSTRIVGAIIMTHGDDSGLKIPPNVAPTQVVVVPISIGDWKENVLPVAQRIEKELKTEGLRIHLDEREEFTPGWKFSEWEMRGIPLRVEIGPRDVVAKQAIVVRRDSGKKEAFPIDTLSEELPAILKDIQKSLFDQALEFQKNNTHEIDNYNEFKSIIESKKGFVKSFWCGDPVCEEKVKEDTMATIRIILYGEDRPSVAGKCVICDKNSDKLAYFARAY